MSTYNEKFLNGARMRLVLADIYSEIGNVNDSVTSLSTEAAVVQTIVDEEGHITDVLKNSTGRPLNIGISKLYDSTGTNTDAPMTQAAVTAEIDAIKDTIGDIAAILETI